MMKKDSALYKAVLLAIVCTVCGLLLSLVNGVTKPIIERNAIAAVEASLKEIYPDGTFKDVTEDYISQDETGLIDGIYEAEGKGYIFTLHNKGYGGDFKFMIGYNNDGTVAGYKGLEHLETPGKGAVCFEGDYVEQVKALTSSDPLPLITGSTITSAAVNDAVSAAKAIFNNIAGISYDPNAEPEKPAEPEAVALSEEDLSDRKASCDGEVCTALGFGGAENKAKVVVKDGKVESFEPEETGDFGDGMGEEAYSELERYIGATLDTKIDNVSGATETSKSFRAMIKAALEGGTSANEEKEEEVKLTLADEDYSSYAKPSCTEESRDGQVAVYACSATGFGEKVNKATITVDDAKVSAFVAEQTGDYGDEVGDKAYTDEIYANYVGATLEITIDHLSGATITSKSFRAMVSEALKAFGGPAAINEEGSSSEGKQATGLIAEDLSAHKASAEVESNDGVTAVVNCTALGFGDKENKAKVTIDLETKTVKAFEVEKTGDYGDEVGDGAYSDDNLAMYNGIGQTAELDNVSGASITSQSFRAMIQAAFAACGE